MMTRGDLGGAAVGSDVRLLSVGANDRLTGSSDRSSKSGGSRYDGSVVGSIALGSPHRRRVSVRTLHRTLVRKRQNEL